MRSREPGVPPQKDEAAAGGAAEIKQNRDTRRKKKEEKERVRGDSGSQWGGSLRDASQAAILMNKTASLAANTDC